MPFRCFQKRSLTRARLSDALNGRRWRFLQSSPDDSQAGLPPLGRSLLTQPTKGPVPILLRTKPEALRETRPGSRRIAVEPQSCTSRLSRTQQAREETVAQTQYCLSRHPLALYPHLAESIPLELFREVVGILDPEMLPEEEEAGMEQECFALSTSQPRLEGKGKRKMKPKNKDPKSKDPYTWLSKPEVAAREREARLNYVPPLDDNVKGAIKEFCRWFDSLGGERYNIDEAAIVSLFDEHYETKLPTLVPIHVVELNNLPAELRKYVETPPPQDPRERPAPPGSQSKELYRPKRERIRYGAWYLDPKTWKKQKASEPLEDPQLEDASVKNAWKILAEKDAEIMQQLYGTHAFKEFLERKGYRIPEFLQQMLAVQKALGPKTRAVKGSRNKFQRRKELQEDAPSNTVNE
ncbi:PREDICTED: protein FAM47E-like [Gekko japonicus]|uniref:Protein FAM47E-like n=1 Tax=Gekko japonicus TaxID=146911 RepID=A0ABM1L9F5_GEKJA|nr:PREDICTED: protein FAM47E-like [Gekko japonicus]